MRETKPNRILRKSIQDQITMLEDKIIEEKDRREWMRMVDERNALYVKILILDRKLRRT